MAVNLLSHLSDQFTPAVVDQLGRQFGESPANMQMLVAGVVPTVLGAIADHVQDNGAETVLNLLNKATYSKEATPLDVSQIADSQERLQTAGITGHQFISGVLGSDTTCVAELLGQGSNTNPVTAAGLMNITGAVLTGMLGQQLHENGLTKLNLQSLLAGQQDLFRMALPAEFSSIGTLLKFGELQAPATPPPAEERIDNLSGTVVNPNIPKSTAQDRQRENSRWLVWALVGVAAIVLALIVQQIRQPQSSTNGIVTDTTARIESDAAEDRSATTRENIRKTNGSTQDTARGPFPGRGTSGIEPTSQSAATGDTKTQPINKRP